MTRSASQTVGLADKLILARQPPWRAGRAEQSPLLRSVRTAPSLGRAAPRSSASCGLAATLRRLVLLDNAAGQSSVIGDGEAVLLRPGADLAAALPAGCRPDRAAHLPGPGRPGVLHEAAQLPAQLSGMPRVEVDRVRPAVYAEFDGLVGGAPGQVVFQLHFDPLHYVPPSQLLPCLAQFEIERAMMAHSHVGRGLMLRTPGLLLVAATESGAPF
jgi:hypothetical protein